MQSLYISLCVCICWTALQQERDLPTSSLTPQPKKVKVNPIDFPFLFSGAYKLNISIDFEEKVKRGFLLVLYNQINSPTYHLLQFGNISSIAIWQLSELR